MNMAHRILTLGLITCSVAPALARQGIGRGPGPLNIVREPAPLLLTGALARWDDGLPIGNGLLGALVWGEGNVLRISLDRGDLWDERLPAPLEGKDWTYATLKKLVHDGNEARIHELFGSEESGSVTTH